MLDKGYRPSSQEEHVAVTRFLEATLDTETSDRMITAMNGMRKKRHRIVYEEMDIISNDEAKQAIIRAEEFVKTVSDLIHQERHKNL